MEEFVRTILGFLQRNSDEILVGLLLMLVAAVSALVVKYLRPKSRGVQKIDAEETETRRKEPSRSNPPARPGLSTQLWTHSDTEDGRIRRADRKSPKYIPETVVVFVHGILSNASIWDALATKILVELDCDVDMFAYQYRADPWHNGSLDTAASDLEQALRAHFPTKDQGVLVAEKVSDAGYRHLVFICHSAGGIVVRHMLRTEAKALLPRITALEHKFHDYESNLLRTRDVISIATPFSGASLPNSAVLILYPAFAFLAVPVLRTVAWLSQGHWDLGYNDVFWKLRWRNHWLKQLNHEYVKFESEYIAAALPFPETTGVFARSDVAIGSQDAQVSAYDAWDDGFATLRPDEPLYRIRGTHLTSKLPRAESRLVRVIARRLERLKNREAALIAERTVARTYDTARDAMVMALFGSEEGETELPAPSVDVATAGTQEWVNGQLLEEAHLPFHTRKLLVTGIAGSGKSHAVARLGRSLAIDFLRKADGSAPLPLVMLSQQYTFTLDEIAGLAKAEDSGSFLLEALVGHWVRFVNGLSYQGALNVGYVLDRLRSGRTVIVLDGIDEFVAHNGLVLHDFEILSVSLEKRSSPGSSRAYVFAVRSGQPGLPQFADACNRTLEVSRLTRDQAIRVFPRARKLIEQTSEGRILEVLLTPLILTKLARAQELPSDALESEAKMLREALMEVIRSRPVATKVGVAPVQAVIDALSLVSWVFYSSFESPEGRTAGGRSAQVSEERLLAGAGRVIASWKAILADGAANRGSEGSDLLAGFELATNEKTLAGLMSTVFVATGGKRWRFEHAKWQDLLCAWYLKRIMELEAVNELRHLAFTQAIFELTGQLLGERVLKVELVKRVIELCRTSPLVYGNVFALASQNPTFGFEGPALKMFTATLSQVPAYVRIVMVNGFCYRILTQSVRDESIATLGAHFRKLLAGYLNDKSIDHVTRSQAWCYLAAFGTKPNTPWPELQFSEECEAAVATSMVGTPDDANGLTDEQRAFQRSLVGLARTTITNPETRPISVAHYTFLLVVAWRRGGGIHRLGVELSEILRKGSPESATVEAYGSVVPEVVRLWELCRNEHSR